MSVVITNYNYARFVGVAIESVRAQSYSNVELIVVDDGSTDGSDLILDQYRSTATIIKQKNGGQGSAFNAGIGRARGDLVCLLDADDSWMPQKIERVVALASGDPDAVVFTHRLAIVDVKGDRTGDTIPGQLVSGKIQRAATQAGGFWPSPPTSGLSFTRAYLDKVMPLPADDWQICADAYLTDLAPFFGSVRSIDEALGCYRVHGANNWTSTSNATRPNSQLQGRAAFLELRATRLNQTLARLGVAASVRAIDHFQYQYLLARLGDNHALARVAILAVKGTPFVARSDGLKAVLSALYRRSSQ